MGTKGGLNLPLPVSSTPASSKFYSCFPPLSVVVPSSLSHFYCKILRNVAKFFSISPASRHLWTPASRPFSPNLSPSCPTPQVRACSIRRQDFQSTMKTSLNPASWIGFSSLPPFYYFKIVTRLGKLSASQNKPIFPNQIPSTISSNLSFLIITL